MTLFRALLWLQMVTPACCGQTASAIVDLFDLQQPPHVFHGSFNTEVFLALEALGHQAPDVIEVLIKGAQSVFASDTRSAGLIAIRALGTLARGSEEARAAMKRLLDRVGDDAEVRGACIASLAQIRGRD